MHAHTVYMWDQTRSNGSSISEEEGEDTGLTSLGNDTILQTGFGEYCRLIKATYPATQGIQNCSTQGVYNTTIKACVTSFTEQRDMGGQLTRRVFQ